MLAMTLYVGILFVLLTPGILLRIPKNGSKWTVAIVHAVVFSLIYYFSHKLVYNTFYKKEGIKILNPGAEENLAESLLREAYLRSREKAALPSIAYAAKAQQFYRGNTPDIYWADQ